MMLEKTMADYYAQRAANYDEIYQRPERQSDINEIKRQLQNFVADKDVLELACGTGFWTKTIVGCAQSVLASDVNQVMLDITAQRCQGEAILSTALLDVFNLKLPSDRRFSTCFAGFLWSHIKREQSANLIESLRRELGAGCSLILIDNNFVEGSSSPTARTDHEGNTYQLREQVDGSRVEIVKNFPTDSFLRKKFSPFTRDIRISRTEYYWMMTCVLK